MRQRLTDTEQTKIINAVDIQETSKIYKNSAIVLIIGDRFFSAYKNNRIQTAWSLAGAHLFGEWREDDIKKIEAIINKKGKVSSRKIVKLA